MELHTSKVVFKEKLRLIPFSDLHLGSRAASESKFRKLVDWVLKKEDTYMIGLGDYADLVTRQDLKRFAGKCTKDDLLDMLDSAVNEQRDLVIKHLKPIADASRLLGLASGNHEYSYKKYHSFDLMKDVCKELKVPHLGYSFFYRWVISKGKGLSVRNVTIYGHHGFGSSRRSGGAMNKRELIMAQYDADIVLMGHDHHKFGSRYIRLSVSQSGVPKIIHKPVILAATGSFLKTVVEGDLTYSEQFGYPPNDIGVVRIDIDLKGHDRDLDIHVSE